MPTPIAAIPMMIPDEFDLGVLVTADEVGLRLVEFIKDTPAAGGNTGECLTGSDCGADRCRTGEPQYSGEE